MSIIVWIILGALAGWAASIIMGRGGQMNLWKNIVIGMVGSIIGGFIATLFGGSGVTGLNFQSFLVALVGAIVLIWGIDAMQKMR